MEAAYGRPFVSERLFDMFNELRILGKLLEMEKFRGCGKCYNLLDGFKFYGLKTSLLPYKSCRIRLIEAFSIHYKASYFYNTRTMSLVLGSKLKLQFTYCTKFINELQLSQSHTQLASHTAATKSKLFLVTKKGCSPKKANMKKDVKSKVVAKKWL